MGKSKARVITASEKLRALVDEGYGIDVELKNLGFKDKGIKKLLAGELADEFEKDPATLRVEGSLGAAVVTRTEKMRVGGDASAVVEAVERGLLGDAVKTEQVLNVPVADRGRAAEILQAAGIAATTSVRLSVDPGEFRVLQGSEHESVEEMEAKKVLKDAVEISHSYRVKYEKARG